MNTRDPSENHSTPDTEMIDWKEQMQIYSTFLKTKRRFGSRGTISHGGVEGEETEELNQRSQEETYTGFPYRSGIQ